MKYKSFLKLHREINWGFYKVITQYFKIYSTENEVRIQSITYEML